MASIVNADNGVVSGAAGLKLSSDTTGILNLQTNGTTAISISASQAVTFTNTPTFTGGTANGVLYLNASKVATSGSALTFSGSSSYPTFKVVGTQEPSLYLEFGIGYAQWYNSYGNIGLNAFLSGEGKSLNSQVIYFAGYNNTADAYLQLFDGKVHVAGNGNVGIGTSSPGAKAEIYVTRTSSTNAVSLILNDNVTGIQTNGVYKAIRSVSNGGGAVSEIRFMETDGTNNNTSISFATQSTANALTERLRIDQNGNLGLGVTPSAWGSGLKVAQVSYGSLVSSATNNTLITSNCYYSGTQWVYLDSAAATVYTQSSGVHSWRTAASGTAGNAITFTQAMTLDASGNLGVGVTSPSRRFQVNSGIDGISGGIAGSTYGIRFDNGGAFSSGMSTIHGVDSTLTGSYQPIMLNGSDVRFGTSATERARITSGGDFGIGTSSPAEKLSVSGTNVSAAIYDSGMAVGGNRTRVKLGVSNNYCSGLSGYVASGQPGVDRVNLGFHVTTFTSSLQTFYEAMTLTDTGRLGIGTTSPESILHIAQASSGGLGAQFILDNTAGSALNNAVEISFLTDGGASGSGTRNARIRAVNENAGNGSANMQFWTWNGSADAERARITAGGDLYVGTTGGDARVTVRSAANAGAIRVYDSSGTARTLVLPDETYGYQYVSTIKTNGNYAMRIENASATLVGGIVTNTSSVAYNTTSDRRLKTNISPADDAGLVIDAIEVVKHDWKAGGHTRYGMIAQDLHEVVPEVVHTPANPDEMMGVDYSKLVPMLVKELQSVRARLAALEAK